MLEDKIQQIQQTSRGTYGRLRLQAALRAEGIRSSAKRIGRLMK